MKNLLKRSLRNFILKTSYKGFEKGLTISDYQFAKGFRNFKISIKVRILDFFFISVGVLCAAFGLKGFLLPSNLIDGGATGIALLISEVFDVPLALGLILVNIPFLLLGYNIMGRKLVLKSCLAMILLAFCVVFITFPNITNDRTLVSVFGGFFLGAGIGLTIRGGAVADGTEILAIYLSKRFGTTIGDIILVLNIFIFGAAAYLLSIDAAMYSLLAYLSASKTIDFIVEGIEEYYGANIISAKSEEIRMMIINKLGRGVTIYKGERGFGKSGETQNEIRIIYTVITRLEISKLKSEIEKIDPNAFVVLSSVKDLKGGMIKKRPLH